jgi:hypothetical protein
LAFGSRPGQPPPQIESYTAGHAADAPEFPLLFGWDVIAADVELGQCPHFLDGIGNSNSTHWALSCKLFFSRDLLFNFFSVNFFPVLICIFIKLPTIARHQYCWLFERSILLFERSKLVRAPIS